jgi:hypothetical protein
MIAVSFTELAIQYKVLWFACKAFYRGTAAGIAAAGRALGKELPFFARMGAQAEEDFVEDSAAPHEQVKMWMWMPGLLLSIICICVVLGVEFDMPVGMSLLSVFLAFFFSFVAIQCTGVTDTTPLTAVSKASQIVLGGATKGENWDIEHAQRLNLIGGAMASIGANQSTDLTADFRTGFLLRTPPNQQWIAQGVGTLVATFLAPAMFQLFATAYPCIIDIDAETCVFAIPSVSAWRATAVAVTDPTFPIPTSSGIFAIVFACFGAAMVFVRHYVWVGKWEFMKDVRKPPYLRFGPVSNLVAVSPQHDVHRSCFRTRTNSIWYSYDYRRCIRRRLGKKESGAVRHLWICRCCRSYRR